MWFPFIIVIFFLLVVSLCAMRIIKMFQSLAHSDNIPLTTHNAAVISKSEHAHKPTCSLSGPEQQMTDYYVRFRTKVHGKLVCSVDKPTYDSLSKDDVGKLTVHGTTFISFIKMPQETFSM